MISSHDFRKLASFQKSVSNACGGIVAFPRDFPSSKHHSSFANNDIGLAFQAAPVLLNRCGRHAANLKAACGKRFSPLTPREGRPMPKMPVLNPDDFVA